MIKNIFMIHMGFIFICVIGIITSFLLFLWEVIGFSLSFKLGITFLIGLWLGVTLMLPMVSKYHDEGIM